MSTAESLLRARKQGDGPRAKERYYLDCRRWGGVMNTPLKAAPTDTRAVTDRDTALRLAEAMVAELEAKAKATQARRVEEARGAAEAAKQAAMLGLSVEADPDLEVVLWDDIIDVCIDGYRTLIDRCPERRGTKVLVYAEDSEVTFEMVEIRALS